MSKSLRLLLASTALTAAIGLPAWSAIRNHETPDASSGAAVIDARSDASAMILASNDKEGVDQGRSDDDDDEEEDEEEEEDDDDGRGGARNAAPLGAVAPPANGLFGTGAPPKVQVK